MKKKTPASKSRCKTVRRKASSGADLLTLFPDYRKPAFQRSVDERTVEYLKELREAYLHVGLALYVGAGVSRSIGLPSWSELIRALTLAMMTRKVQSAFATLGTFKEEKYWEAVAKIQEDVEKSVDYDRPMLMMARAIKDELKDELPFAITRMFSRHLRRSCMMARHHDDPIMLKSQSHVPYSPLLNALVCLARSERDTKGVQAIINYNYDDTLDTAMRDGNVRCVSVKSGKDRVPQGDLPCYHVHGVLPVMASGHMGIPTRNGGYGNFVFSEDEYHAEYSDPYRWSNMTQISLLGQYTGLFVGLSLEDPNIRRLIDVTHRQYPESHNYAILPRKCPLARSKDTKGTVLRNIFEQVETSSFEKIGMRVIWVDSFEAMPSILHKICIGEKTTPNEALHTYAHPYGAGGRR